MTVKIDPGIFPTRAPSNWELGQSYGEVSPTMDLFGISNRQVVITIEKNFSFIEGLIARILRAPANLRRPLDQLNSGLWQLMDGTRSLGEIAEAMEECFEEAIIPSEERCSASILILEELNLVILADLPNVPRSRD